MGDDGRLEGLVVALSYVLRVFLVNATLTLVVVDEGENLNGVS